MLSMNNLKIGTVFSMEGVPYTVISAQHVQMGRGGAILRTKLKNLITGSLLERTFKSGDGVDEADLEKKKVNFLYREGNSYFFMDEESYDQFFVTQEQVGESAQLLKEGQSAEAMFFNEKPIQILLPKKITLKVTETADAIRGDTAQGTVTKEATLETGYTVKVPLFIKSGDLIVINTDTLGYGERAQKE